MRGLLLGFGMGVDPASLIVGRCGERGAQTGDLCDRLVDEAGELENQDEDLAHLARRAFDRVDTAPGMPLARTHQAAVAHRLLPGSRWRTCSSYRLRYRKEAAE